MDMQKSLADQFMGALEMMKRAIERCPDNLWDDPDERNRFWHVGELAERLWARAEIEIEWIGLLE